MKQSDRPTEATTSQTPARFAVLSVVAMAVALALTWSTTAPALANNPYDRVPRAQQRILGQHLTNHHTHMETWIVGWYPYERRVRIHQVWTKKTFYGLRVSAQHCNSRSCWGPVVTGKLWSPHQPGRPLRSATRTRALASQASSASIASTPTTAATADLCIQGTTSCAAPWNWFAGVIDTRQQKLVQLFVDPCGKGTLFGGGVVLSRNLAARILFEGGVMTAAKTASVFEGPPGMALGALAGCMTGVGAKGISTVTGLLDHLDPFNRGVPGRG
jgi:hypothetical protein